LKDKSVGSEHRLLVIDYKYSEFSMAPHKVWY
jgi:hypothetical protein